jgi:hypothetical protein
MWYYQGAPIRSIEDCPEEAVGFIYCITDPNGKIYLGKKILHNSTWSKISKREKTQTKTRKTYKRTIKESDWLTYWGSCKDPDYRALLEQTGKLGWDRKILEFCCTKRMMSIRETYYQLTWNVLERDTWNGYIQLGKVFRKDIKYCI